MRRARAQLAIDRENNSDPYAPWVIRVAKIKRAIFFWRK